MQKSKPFKPTWRVLVVDDDRDTVQTLATLLRLMGHEVAAVMQPAEAVAVAKSFRPNIAFVDLGMPKIDGYALASILRATPDLRAIPLVAVSGHGTPEDRARVRQADFDAHVLKPVDPPMIDAILRQFIQD